MDWQRWHAGYDEDGSLLARRLHTVQSRIRDVLDESPPGPLSVLSLCAGDGRDLLGALPDGSDVRARLVELDPELGAAARRTARARGLRGVEVVAGDAGLTEHCRGFAPADLVLLCGVFGNLTDADIEATIGFCPQLCRPGGSVIWTRYRNPPDRVPLICDRFAELGFDLRWLTEPGNMQAVGVHRFAGRPQPLEEAARMFTFVGYDVLEGRAETDS